MISVVIPAFNAGACLSRAIDSVLGQSFADLEIIVVDDGSSDHTAEVAGRYGDRITYVRQENAGASVARNRGIALARGEWIAFLDADDEWLPHKLERQMRILDSDRSLVWCAGNYCVDDGSRRAPAFSEKKARAASARGEIIDDYFAAAFRKHCQITTVAIVIRKELFKTVGGFDPKLLRGQDTDLWWRIAHRYPRIGWVPEPVVIVHLDIEDSLLDARRLETKRGLLDRTLVSRHLVLASEHGSAFRPLGIRILKKSILTAVYHGHFEDAEETVELFREVLDRSFYLAASAIFRFPGAAQIAMRSAEQVAHRMRLKKKLGRRWDRRPRS